MKSIKDLTGNIVDETMVNNFEFIEGTFSFDEMKGLLGKSQFASFLMQYLTEQGIKIETGIKNGVESFRPIKLTSGKLLKFWTTQDGELADVSIFQPKSLF